MDVALALVLGLDHVHAAEELRHPGVPVGVEAGDGADLGAAAAVLGALLPGTHLPPVLMRLRQGILQPKQVCTWETDTNLNWIFLWGWRGTGREDGEGEGAVFSWDFVCAMASLVVILRWRTVAHLVLLC